MTDQFVLEIHLKNTNCPNSILDGHSKFSLRSVTKELDSKWRHQGKFHQIYSLLFQKTLFFLFPKWIKISLENFVINGAMIFKCWRDFRSAFRMPTSRSYPRHLVQFYEKKRKKEKHFTSFLKQTI